MLKPELLARLTPESLAGFEQADKQRVLAILNDLQLTGFQRYKRDLYRRLEAWRRDCVDRGIDPAEDLQSQLRERHTSLADIIAEARKNQDNPNREHSMLHRLANEPDEIARQERLERESQEALKAEMERCRQARLEAQPERVEPEIEPASNLPRPLSIAEVARHAQEQAFAEAKQFDPNFIDRISGPGSDKPSGRSGNVKFGFMG